MMTNLNVREQVIGLTKEWDQERFEDGRPRVPDEYLEILRGMTLEEVWLPLYIKGYRFQFEGSLNRLHPAVKMVGRAVTCTFVPARPDLCNAVIEYGEGRGWKGTCNQWVIDSLTQGDVVVADMYDKIYNGTFIGGNLTTAIKARTKNGGAVIWGGIRDVEQMRKIEDIEVCYRGVDRPESAKLSVCREMWCFPQRAVYCLFPLTWWRQLSMKPIKPMQKIYLVLKC